MNALVTGCAGFIGSHLAESLLQDGVHVVGVDCFNANYARREKLLNLGHAREWDEFEFVPIDLSRGDLSDFVADCDVIFHLAAEPGVRESWGERFGWYVRNNILATQLLLDALAPWPNKRLVYASSSAIYGEAERQPTAEGVLPQPISPYGMTKLAAEHLCQMYRSNYGVDVVALRYFSVYGPRQRPDMAFHRFCKAALTGSPISVFGDGTQTRDFTFVDDVVAATRSASTALQVAGEVFNIGGGSQIAVNETLSLISELSGRELDVRYVDPQSGDPKGTGADTTSAQAKLGFATTVNFQDGLRAQFEWMASTASALE
jgi:UDP-glucuronate 4-epimerase